MIQFRNGYYADIRVEDRNRTVISCTGRRGSMSQSTAISCWRYGTAGKTGADADPPRR